MSGVIMSLLRGHHIAVWFERGVPTRIVYDGNRYRVSDQPTRLEDEMAVLTHPLAITGWRFQATDSHHISRVFDIRQRGNEWLLLRVYD
jgi:hypothetical protein